MYQKEHLSVHTKQVYLTQIKPLQRDFLVYKLYSAKNAAQLIYPPHHENQTTPTKGMGHTLQKQPCCEI